MLLSCQTHVSAQSGQNGAQNSPHCKRDTQRKAVSTALAFLRSDSGTDAACRAIKEPKPKPEPKAAESAESSAQTPQRSPKAAQGYTIRRASIS